MYGYSSQKLASVATMIGKYARQKAKRLTSLKDYRKVAYISECKEWVRLENDKGWYMLPSLVILSDELESQLIQARKEIADIKNQKGERK